MTRDVSRRLSAIIVLVTMLGGVVTPLFGDLHTETDIACTDDGWTPAHHQNIQFESVRPTVGDGHCAVCHLQRAMGGAADDAKRFVAESAMVTASVTIIQRVARSHARRDVPSRAPPSFL